MNERIKELAEQCWEERKYGPAWFNQEKFAELIIRECMQTVKDNIPKDEDDDWDWQFGYRRAMNDCLHHISEHFGVE